MKKTLKRLSLHKETLAHLDLLTVTGGQTDGCWVSRAFTNCTYCDTKTLWADCVEITQN